MSKRIYTVESLPEGWLRLSFPYDEGVVERIKQISPKMRRWVPLLKQWEMLALIFFRYEAVIFPARDWNAVKDYRGGNTSGSQSREQQKPASRATTSTPHAALFVTSDAPFEVIEAAYRALIRKHHPDMGGDEETAKRINAAYHELKGRNQR